MNMILSKQTGLPFTPTLANSVANTGTASRPNLAGDWHIAEPTLTRWFNTDLNTAGAPWATPAQFNFATSLGGVAFRPRARTYESRFFSVQAVCPYRAFPPAIPG